MLELLRLVRAIASSLRHDDRGANMLEYGLLVTLIAIVVTPAVVILAPLVAALYTRVLAAF